MKEEELTIIRCWLIEHIFRNGTIMYNDNIRGDDNRIDDIDLIEVIASLYEVLHREVTHEPYEYMFHWANKVGSWCDDQLFINLIKENKKQ